MSQNPKLLIGCPIRSREWAVEAYFDHAVPAARNATDNFAFTFVVPKDDEATIDAIHVASRKHEVNTRLAFTTEPSREDKRIWNTDRYEEMCVVRNAFLRQARDGAHKPDYLLSLDSDIQIHPQQIKGMIEHLEEHPEWAAIGGKTYLSATGKQHPSYGQLKRGHKSAFLRSDSEGVFQVDIIMAIKLMTPAAYEVDYKANRYGEDIGWSIEVNAAGLKLGWDGSIASKHVMTEAHNGREDPRCGY